MAWHTRSHVYYGTLFPYDYDMVTMWVTNLSTSKQASKQPTEQTSSNLHAMILNVCGIYRFRIEYFVVIDAKRFTMIQQSQRALAMIRRGRKWRVHFLMLFFSLQCSTLIFANGFNGANTWHTFHLKVINPVTINYHRGKCNVANIMCVCCMCVVHRTYTFRMIEFFILFHRVCCCARKTWMNASFGLSLQLCLWIS